MMSQQNVDVKLSGDPLASDASDPTRVSVEDLFDGSPEIRLVFRGVEYRLRITRNGKLILTK
jgi:hemin uptake protein HemP